MGRSKQLRHWRWGALLLLLIAAGIGVWENTTKERTVQRLPVVDGCPLHLQVCEANLPGGGTVRFEMTPKEPNPVEPLQLKATFQGVTPQRVEVSFEGKDMYMGYLVYPLSRQTEAEEILFSGRGSLSICVRSLMEWIAYLRVDLGDTIYEIPFAFETFHQ